MCKALPSCILSFTLFSHSLSFSVCVYVRMCLCLCCAILEMYCCVALQQGACRSEQHFGSHFSSKQGGGKEEEGRSGVCLYKGIQGGKGGSGIAAPNPRGRPSPFFDAHTVMSAQEVSLCVFL